MHSLNVAMISTYLYPKIGGSEKQLLTLAKTLKKKGMHITILTQRYDRELPKHDTVEGVPIHRLPVAGAGIWASISFMISLCYYLAKNRKHINIIHVSLASSPAVVAVFVGWMVKKKVIIKLGGGSHYGDIRTSRKTIPGRMKLAFLRFSNAFFIAVSSEIRDELIHAGFNLQNIICIPNGVDTDIYYMVGEKEKKNLRESYAMPDDAVIFMFSGRLVEGKNIDGLLDIWVLSKPKERNMVLLIIGDGPERIRIKDKIQSLDVRDTIIMKGFRGRIEEWYKLSDVFISLSLSEGLSNSVLEALACGLPVISTRVGGIHEIIKHGEEGILIQDYRKDAISETISMLAEHHAQRKSMGEKAAQKIRQYYSIHSTAEQYMNIYLS